MEKTVQTELNRIQKELVAPKSQVNAFGKYKYRSCEDILSAYKKVAGETTLVIQDEIILVGERYYIKATATLEYNGQFHTATAFAREPKEKRGMDESQITGAASSYGRKYSLNGLFAIDDTKDADSMDNRNTGEKSAVKLDLALDDVVSLKRKFWAKFTAITGGFGTPKCDIVFKYLETDGKTIKGSENIKFVAEKLKQLESFK